MTTDRPVATTTPGGRGTVPLARIAGVPIGAHWSVVGIVVLLAVALARVELPLLRPGHSAVAYAVAGVVAALLVVVSLLAHEAAHAVVARRLGMRVEGVTLWILGGVTRLRGEPERPGVELRMAAAGPLTSGLLGAASLGAADLLPAGLTGAVLIELAWVNLVLAAFNLLPAAPLDGGRLLHALLWARRGDRWGAAATCASAGLVLAGVLVLGGLALTTVTGLGGLWLVVVGWWIGASAAQEGRRARLGRALDGLVVGDVARPAPRVVTPPGALDAATLHDGAARTGGVLLREADGRWAGFLPPEGLPGAAGVIAPGFVAPERLTTVPATAPLMDALAGLGRPDARLVVVDPAGRPTGTVAVADVLRLAGGAGGRPARVVPGPEEPPPAGWWWPGGAPPVTPALGPVPAPRDDR